MSVELLEGIIAVVALICAAFSFVPNWNNLLAVAVMLLAVDILLILSVR